ncbi:MAG: ATP-dependent RNA helicase DbpA [Methylococcaceae bacterium]|nr:ATP-dependent RNA helicase DbpA [Methylococcaceae bacterium]
MTNTHQTSSPTPAADLAGSRFDQLPLSTAMLENLRQLQYLTMTPIQAASLPIALAGTDLIAQAKTGSGKTAAFALPILKNLNQPLFKVQSLVLCPTRELAEQVSQEIRRLARFADNIKVLALCGGTLIRPQMTSLEHGAHIVVGTPGRIMDHLQRGSLSLDHLTSLVLDEADRMLDMGFYDDINAIAKQCPKQRQTLLFSATYPHGIAKLAQQLLHNPQQIHLHEQHASSKIRQRFYEIDDNQRFQAVAKLLRHYRPVNCLAFCNTKQQCRDLLNELLAQGFSASTLNGDLEQRDRDQVLIQFANRSCSVLIATDVAARGLDISQLEAVINVDISPDPEIHVHRIGRTGRADEAGWALSLFSPQETPRVNSICQFMGKEPEWQALNELSDSQATPLQPTMVTLQILAGRKDKIRPGDVLGALTADAGFKSEQIGKINVTEQLTYVAVERSIGREAVRKLSDGKIKGKSVKVRLLNLLMM